MKSISEQMKVSFEILEARLMHEIYQLKAMITILLPNNAANYQYNAFTHTSPYHQPLFHELIYPISTNNYEQTTYGTQNSNQPISYNFQPTNIPQTQHPTSTNNPFRIKSAPTSVIDKPTTEPSSTTESVNNLMLKSGTTEVKASTVRNITERILEFKPVQTKSLNRHKSRQHK